MLSPQDNGRGDTTLSPQEVPGEVTENGERGDRNGGVEVPHRVAAQRTCEPENLKSAAHAARTSRGDRESDDNTATDGPVARTAHAALKQPLAEQEQPPPCRATSKKMGRPVNADADPASAEVYRRGREVLGDDADAVITELLAAHDGYVDAALDTLAVAEEESDPRQYVQMDIEAEAAARRQRQ